MLFNSDSRASSHETKVKRISATLMSTDTIRSKLLYFLLPSLVLTFCHAQDGWVRDKAPNAATTVSQDYAEKMNNMNSMPFGESNVTLMGNARTESGEFLDAGMFPTAGYCRVPQVPIPGPGIAGTYSRVTFTNTPSGSSPFSRCTTPSFTYPSSTGCGSAALPTAPAWPNDPPPFRSVDASGARP